MSRVTFTQAQVNALQKKQSRIDQIKHQLKHGICNLTESDFNKPANKKRTAKKMLIELGNEVNKIKRSKYGNKKITTEDGTFDSKKEFNRWLILKDMQGRQEIFSLTRQTGFNIVINGKHICTYFSDFDYWKDGKHIIEDAKGFKTATYRLKKKMVEAEFGIEIIEV